MWVSHVTCEWVMSHVSESYPCNRHVNHVTCVRVMSQVKCEWVMSHMSESRHMSVSHVTCKWVICECVKSRYSEEQLLRRTASYPCGTNMNCHTSRSHVTLLWENTFCSTLYRVPVVKTWVISQLSQSYHTSQREQLLLHSVLGKGEGEKGQGVEENQILEPVGF